MDKKESEMKNSLRIEKMRKGIKNMDDFDFDISDEMLERMHDKIMQKVNEAEMEKSHLMDKPKRYLRAHYRGWLYSASTGVACLALLSVMMQNGVFSEKPVRMADLDHKSKAIALAAQEAPEQFSNTILGEGLESQFFVDAATESFENLNISQVKTIIGN